MLVSARDMLEKAREGKYAVGQFNINNLEWTKSILLTAQELKSPVILGVSEGAGKYMTGYKTVVGMVNGMLEELGNEVTVFEQEFFPEQAAANQNDPYTVEYDAAKDEYVVEGPRVEKMLGYTNLESEKGFAFFQNFLKTNGILEQLEALGIQDGDTVRIYGHSFDYYK